MTAAPLRFGYHGSLRAARAIVQGAGHRVERFSFVEYDITDPFLALRGGELDLMIVKFGRTEPDLEYSATVATDHRVAVFGAHHPLAGRTSVSVEELADFDGFRCPGTFPPGAWDEVVPPRTPAGRPIRRRHELTGAGSMMATVERTDAVHISLRSLADIASPSVRVVPVHDLPPAPVRLAMLRGHPPGHLREFVRDTERAAGVWTDEHGGPREERARGLRAQEGRRRMEVREALSGARQSNTERVVAVEEKS